MFLILSFGVLTFFFPKTIVLQYVFNVITTSFFLQFLYIFLIFHRFQSLFTIGGAAAFGNSGAHTRVCCTDLEFLDLRFS